MIHRSVLWLDVDHGKRSEQHGRIVIDARKAMIKSCHWETPQAPRFLEAMSRGRKWYELPHLAARICGSCGISHALASVKAIEAAMGVPVSRQTANLRRLCMHAEVLQSHILHIGHRILPDYTSAGGVVSFASGHPKEHGLVARLHRLACDTSTLLAGPMDHRLLLAPGGFSELPDRKALAGVKVRLQDAIPDFLTAVELFFPVADSMPSFERKTESIALVHPDEYPLYDGRIGSSDGGNWPVSEYKAVMNEHVVPDSSATYTRHNRASYRVGALARFNLNGTQLSPLARELAACFRLQAASYNGYMNNAAQLIECAHSMEDSIRLIDEVLAEGPKKEESHAIEPKAGQGVSALETPRGTLFHDYEFDKEGRCVHAKCLIPTNQNYGNIQKDLEDLLPRLLGKAEEEMALYIEMLVRAYDPCEACTTPLLEIEFQSGNASPPRCRGNGQNAPEEREPSAKKKMYRVTGQP